MKTIKYKIIVFLLIITSCSLQAQYDGGNADGSSMETLNTASCSIPPSFYTYFGGDGDASTVDNLLNTTCSFSDYFYAYFGGDANGSTVETLENQICDFPPQFFTYFGGNADGSVVDTTSPVCPTQPPVADFTASATSICVGQAVTFTDTSTNLPSVWTWTFTGGTPNSATVQNPVIVYNTPGTYTVTLLAANFNGNDTETKTSFITVNAIPTVVSTTPAGRCDSGTLTLQATASSAASLNWYAAATGGTALAIGTSFTTPSLTTTTTYYVEAQFGTCTSARTSVIATVNTTPTITGTTPANRCGNGSVMLQATASPGTIQWFTTATGGTVLATGTSFTTPSLSATTTYYVQVTQNNCTSTRIAVIATVNTTPSITGTTPANRCGNGSVTLQATASAGTIQWFATATGGTALATGTSFTTPSLSATTTYYVEVVNGTCNSTRTAVTATVSQTAAPTGIANQTFCEGETVGLILVSGTNVIWYSSATGGAVISSSTPLAPGTYYASQTSNSCESTTRFAVTMTLGGCLGVDDFVKLQMNIYPNPTRDIVNVISNQLIEKVEIINLLGQKLISEKSNLNEVSINLENLPTATYILRVTSEDNVINTFKILKK